jgi:hypothetical protein
VDLFDCEGAHDEPVPIYVGDHGEGQRLVLPSIGELVAVWIDLIKIGAFATDEDGNWRHDTSDLVPSDVRKLGVY